MFSVPTSRSFFSNHQVARAVALVLLLAATRLAAQSGGVTLSLRSQASLAARTRQARIATGNW